LKKNKISKNWINKQKKDIFIRQSKIEGYRSRAVYKIKEIDDKFKILKNGISLIDLGAAPGSWTQYVAKKIKNGKILSIDLKRIDEIPNTLHIIGDFANNKTQDKITKYFKEKKIDVILSDMAANTSGNKKVDSIVTGELCLEGLRFAIKVLKKDGVFIAKFFMGSIFNEIMTESKRFFKKTNVFKPLSSKKESKESFIICRSLK